MTDHVSDGHIDRLVKARWLAIGLSQSDLAEVLGAAITLPGEDGGASDRNDAARLTKIAEALELPAEMLHRDAAATRRSSLEHEFDPLQTMLDLRLLRAFRQLRDLRIKRMLVQLAEQMVKRQNRRGDGVG